MDITYNGLTSHKDIITFTGVPNILTYTPDDANKTKAYWELTIVALNNIDPNKTYHVYFGDYSISSVPTFANAGGTNFYLPQQNTYQNQMTLAYSIMRALRNVPYIAANYEVWMYDDEDGGMFPEVRIEARKEGPQYDVTLSTDLPTADWSIQHSVPGQTDDQMFQGTDNRIHVDLYRFPVPNRIGSEGVPATRDYVTSLEKSYYGQPISFNLTPVLSSLVDEGEMAQYMMTVYGFSDGRLIFGEQTDACYVTPGYQVNQSEPFIGTFNGHKFAANVNRGDDRAEFNKTYLYTYYPRLEFSMFLGDQIGQTTCQAQYLNSAGTVLKTDNIRTYSTEASKSLWDFVLTLDEEQLKTTYYVDVTIPDVGKIRYNVISPLNAADEVEAQRIWWRNEYGGISFMDFTGERSEQRKEEIGYYTKQDFDFYVQDGRERTRVYDKKIDITVKHRTHNIDRNGTYLLYSLQNSSVAWTEVNGIKYFVHITNLTVTEATNATHIYTGEIEYTYSMPDLV